jgi:hypothetical protein
MQTRNDSGFAYGWQLKQENRSPALAQQFGGGHVHVRTLKEERYEKIDARINISVLLYLRNGPTFTTAGYLTN